MAKNTIGSSVSTEPWLKNQSRVAVEVDGNVTEEGDVFSGFPWQLYLEAVFLGIFCLLGIVGNTLILRCSVKITRFAKHNVYLFFGLSLGDLCVCLIRGPCLIFVLFYTPKENDPFIACDVWAISTIFVVVVIITNMIVAIERIMIMCSFRKYLKLFTSRNMLALNIAIWVGVAIFGILFYKVLQLTASVHADARACFINSLLVEGDKIGGLITRAIFVTAFGVTPILITASCYTSIVVKVCKAGLLKLDMLDDNASYTRVTCISLSRVLLAFLTWMPFLSFVVIGPLYIENMYPLLRFFEYIVILQSAISPFITMHDTDFKDTFARRKWKTCIYVGRKLKRTSTKDSRRSNNITSTEMRTVN